MDTLSRRTAEPTGNCCVSCNEPFVKGDIVFAVTPNKFCHHKCRWAFKTYCEFVDMACWPETEADWHRIRRNWPFLDYTGLSNGNV